MRINGFIRLFVSPRAIPIAGVLLFIVAFNGFPRIPKVVYFRYEDFYAPATPPLELCPEPWNMTWLGKISVNTRQVRPENITVGNIGLGGHWTPSDCIARRKVAILLPYRDREVHLWKFLYHMHPFLQAQKLEYQIYIIEQGMQSKKFNRAKLFNIGFLEASKEKAWDAFIFHDIDLLPFNTKNIYDCSDDHPRHMSVAIDKFHYRLLYEGQFGGVSCMTNKTFYHVNGFSNAYFGWGGEDDDIANRMNIKGLRRMRYPPKVSVYIMMSHKNLEKLNQWYIRTLLDATEYLMKFDGVGSTKYDVTKVEKKTLFTKIFVDFINDEQYYKDALNSTSWKAWRNSTAFKAWSPNHKSRKTYEVMKW